MSGMWVEGGRVTAVSLALACSAPFMSSDLFAQPADHTASQFFSPFFSFRMFSASGHRSTTPSSSFSTLSSCSEELHNFALSTSTALSLSLLLCCSLARLYVSSEHCSSLSELTFFALFALRVCLFALL